MRALVCGSRTFEDRSIVIEVLQGVYDQVGWWVSGSDLTIIAGEAPGADTLAKEWVTVHLDDCHVHYEGYPADWEKYGKPAGPIRNQQMLDEGKPDRVLAFVDRPLAMSRGTFDMVNRAKKAGIPTYVVQRIE